MRRVYRKLRGGLRYARERVRTQLVGTTISDADFARKLSMSFPTISAYLEYTISRKLPDFFVNPSRRWEFVDAVRTTCPKAEALTVSVADQACAHIFNLLGSGPVYLGEHIDWHIDFKTGHRFDPDKYYADVGSAPYPGGYDIKVPWELSRCQHFAWLGQAYWFTEDEKYAHEFVAQIEDWNTNNPWPRGVNWACTMDVAIRAVNWLWGYYFFKDSSILDNGFLADFFKSLWVHGQHIWHNLENKGDFTGNHYLSDLVGLIYLGILCPEFKEARKWREFGLQELEKEMFKQVYPDGVNFEASTSYHRLVTEMFLSVVILAQLNGHEFSIPFMARLEKMVEFVMYLVRPDGTAPLIGDNDNGRLHRLKVWNPPEQEWVDFSYLLAIGAVLFERADFAQVAEDQWEEAIWLFGTRALTLKQTVPARQHGLQQSASRAFLDAGLYVMCRDEWHLTVSVGPNGQDGNGGHAHNDKLSFELYAHGQTWIVDAGAYVYTADYHARNQFRSTAFHNTVQVDTQEQNILSYTPRDLFRLPDITQSRQLHWITHDDYTLFIGEQCGYMRLHPPVLHRRILFYDRLSSSWIVHDQLHSLEQHDATTYFHFAPCLVVQPLAEPSVKSGVQIAGSKVKLYLIALQGHSNPPQINSGVVSLGYGMQESAPVVAWPWNKEGWESVIAITTDIDQIERITAAFHRCREICESI